MDRIASFSISASKFAAGLPSEVKLTVHNQPMAITRNVVQPLVGQCSSVALLTKSDFLLAHV